MSFFHKRSHSFADELLSAKIARSVRTGPDAEAKVKQHCTSLRAKATPLEDSSVQAYSFCLEVSQKLNWFNSWSHLCARELSELRPADFPRANEFHGPPSGVSDILDTEALITAR